MLKVKKSYDIFMQFCRWIIILFLSNIFFNRPSSASFSFILVFSSKQYKIHIKLMWKNVHPVSGAGIKLTTFWTSVFFINHQTGSRPIQMNTFNFNYQFSSQKSLTSLSYLGVSLAIQWMIRPIIPFSSFYLVA